MNLEQLLEQLAGLPTRAYTYVMLTAAAGPLVLRLFGMKTLAGLIRPLALLVFVAGMYAKQQQMMGPRHD